MCKKKKKDAERKVHTTSNEKGSGTSTDERREILALAAIRVLVVTRHSAAALVNDLARERVHA